jgi:hypothetical protein
MLGVYNYHKDGAITDASKMTADGIFYGKDIQNSPITGDVMFLTSVDAIGNRGFMLIGSTEELWLGSQPLNSPTISWKRTASTDYVDSKIPPLPTADGDYKLNIAGGKATWVTV